MKLFKNLICFLLIIVTHDCISVVTPTQAYLDQTSIEEIVDTYEYDFSSIHDTLPFFMEIASYEDENFFGYHAASTKYRLFQDILNAVFEEVLDYNLPQDFYFLRIPGLDDFNIANNKSSFLETFGRKITPELRKNLIQIFILDTVNKNFDTQFRADNFSDEELISMEGVFYDLAEYIDPLIDRTANATVKLPKIKKGNAGSSYIQSVKEKSKEIMDFIIRNENSGMTPKFSPLIIKSVVEVFKNHIEVNDELKTFLHKSLNPKSLYTRYYILSIFDHLPYNFYAFLFPFDDTKPEQQNRVVCMNIALFGNYFRWDESSLYIFANDSSIESGESRVINLLAAFFDEIGLPKEKAQELYDMGRDIIRNSGNKMGTLLQFFDETENIRLEDIDESSFVSLDFGKPIMNINSSDLVKGLYPPKKNELDLQLRLIMGNDSTLNPNGPLRIKRYDMLSKETSSNLINSMKESLKNTPIDQQKKDAYLQKLDALWSHDVCSDCGQF